MNQYSTATALFAFQRYVLCHFHVLKMTYEELTEVFDIVQKIDREFAEMNLDDAGEEISSKTTSGNSKRGIYTTDGKSSINITQRNTAIVMARVSQAFCSYDLDQYAGHLIIYIAELLGLTQKDLIEKGTQTQWHDPTFVESWMRSHNLADNTWRYNREEAIEKLVKYFANVFVITPQMKFNVINNVSAVVNTSQENRVYATNVIAKNGGQLNLDMSNDLVLDLKVRLGIDPDTDTTASEPDSQEAVNVEDSYDIPLPTPKRATQESNTLLIIIVVALGIIALIVFAFIVRRKNGFYLRVNEDVDQSKVAIED
jgi:hypothetical protein